MVSWLLLKGRCRSCEVRISPRYPIVELLSAVLWVLAGWRFGPTVQCGFAVAFFYVLLILTWIDLDTMRLPNVLVGFLAAVGFGGAVLAQLSGIVATPLVGLGPLFGFSPLATSVAGAVVTAVPALLLSLIMSALLKRPTLGMGDVKLLGAMGLFLGAYGLLAFFVGSFVGIVLVVAARVVKGTGSDAATADSGLFPFGPALAIGGIIVALVGPQLWLWYQALLQV